MKTVYLIIKRIYLSYQAGELWDLINKSGDFFQNQMRIIIALATDKLRVARSSKKKTHFIPDVYLISHPKAGRTWIRVMLAKLLEINGGDPKKLELIRYRHDGSDQISLNWFSKIDPYSNKENWIKKRIILLVRDPRDITVSFYFQLAKKNKHLHDFRGTLSNFVRSKKYGIEHTILFYNSWYEYKDVPKEFLLVRYEELKKNTEKELIRMCNFLRIQKEISNKAIKEAVEYASFESMRKMEMTKIHLLSNTGALEVLNPNDPESLKTRKGVVGGYVKYLNKKDIKYVNEQMKKLNPNLGYKV